MSISQHNLHLDVCLVNWSYLENCNLFWDRFFWKMNLKGITNFQNNHMHDGKYCTRDVACARIVCVMDNNTRAMSMFFGLFCHILILSEGFKRGSLILFWRFWNFTYEVRVFSTKRYIWRAFEVIGVNSSRDFSFNLLICIWYCNLHYE